MSDLRDHVVVVVIAARRRFRQQARVLVRIEAQHARCHDPRLREHFGVFERHLVAERVALPCELLDDVQLIGVKISALLEPGQIVKCDRVDDERVAFPATH